MRKIREIFRLKYEFDLSDSKISRSLSVSKSTVGKYIDLASERGIEWEQIKDLSDEDLGKLILSGNNAEGKVRGSRPLPDWTEIRSELSKKHVTLLLLWREYIEEHPDGYRYSQFCERYKKWRRKIDVSMRQVHIGGEKLFVDYAGSTVNIFLENGKTRKVSIFVAVLGASNYFYTEAHFGEKKKNWINAHIRAFEFFGGVPMVVVCDNLKSGVTSPDYYEPDLNSAYYEMAVHYHTAVIPARVRKPKDKSKAEVGVQVVGQSILAVLRNRPFHSLQELNKELAVFTAQINNRMMGHIGSSRSELFEKLDKPNLQPLPKFPFVFTEWKKAKVGIDYHVGFEKNFYSVPYQYSHAVVEIKATEQIVEIYKNGKTIARHLRNYDRNQYITLEKHMPENHKKMLEWTPERIVTWAEKQGGNTGRLIRKILEASRFPQQSYRKCLGIIKLNKTYGADRLDLACERAMHFEITSYKKLKNILEKGIESDPIETADNQTVSTNHKNIRGDHYYRSKEFAHAKSETA